MLVVAQIAVEAGPVMGGSVWILRLHLGCLLHQFLRVVACDAPVHFYFLWSFGLVMAFVARHSAQAVYVAAREFSREAQRIDMTLLACSVIHLLDVSVVPGKHLIFAVAKSAVIGLGGLHPLWRCMD